MKTVFIFLLLVVTTTVSAQTDSRIFYSQLMVVFSDLDKHFEFLKGELKEQENKDSLFETGLTLEGTKDNSILVSPGVCAYQAMISDSVSEEGSQLILKAWKEKLDGALEGMFTPSAKEFVSETDPGTNGYQYSSEKILVLLLRHKAEDGSYWINLVIKQNNMNP